MVLDGKRSEQTCKYGQVCFKVPCSAHWYFFSTIMILVTTSATLTYTCMYVCQWLSPVQRQRSLQWQGDTELGWD